METEGTAIDAMDEALSIGETDEELLDDAESTEDDGDLESESGDEGDEGAQDDDSEDSDDSDSEEAKARAKSEFNEDGTRKKPEAKKSDPINDPIPKDLKKETSERMQSLVKIAKEVTAERDRVKTEFDTIIGGIRATGSTPEQYGEVMSFMSLFNSPQREAKMKAYGLVNDVAERMATMLGIDRAVADPLAQHQDLKQAVAQGKVTPEYAREIARTRNQQQFTGQLDQHQRQQQQTQAQAQQEEQEARSALTEFEKKMRKEDPLYEQKRAMIVPLLKPIFAAIPKREWAQRFQEAYANAKVQPRGNTAKAKQQPLRGGKQPAGGQVRQAGSMMEAINGALASIK